MSKNWGRTPVTNADRRMAPPLTYFVETKDGKMQRTDRRPLGKVEQFVDADGNVCSIQMYADGDGRKHETEQRNRSNQHSKGSIEHAKCPLRHGTRQFALKDFMSMPASMLTECPSDPRPFTRLNYRGEPAQRGEPSELHAGKACPHIEWLIEHRRAESAKQRAMLNPYAADMEKTKAKEAEIRDLQAELLKEQIVERKARKTKGKESAE